jgi:hypothetical protein
MRQNGGMQKFVGHSFGYKLLEMMMNERNDAAMPFINTAEKITRVNSFRNSFEPFPPVDILNRNRVWLCLRLGTDQLM